MKNTAPPPELDALLRPGQSIELLKQLHILTRDGKLNQDSRRKLKQVNHLCQLIEPLIAQCQPHDAAMSLADHGAGKSYLGFLLLDLVLKHRAQPFAMYGIETRKDLVDKSSALAKQLGFTQMHFLESSVADATASTVLPQKIDIVTALHACDTATDDAIDFALAKSAQAIVLVPCCQAELARHLREYKNAALGATPLAQLWRHPIHTREIGAHLTNVLRCLKLEAAGYDVTVTELVGWEHSMKNELILATKRKSKPHGDAGAKLNALIEQFHLQGLRARFTYAGN